MNLFKFYNQNYKKLIKIPGVISVGLSGNKIFVKVDNKELLNRLPKEIEGIGLEVEFEDSEKQNLTLAQK